MFYIKVFSIIHFVYFEIRINLSKQKSEFCRTLLLDVAAFTTAEAADGAVAGVYAHCADGSTVCCVI